MLKYPDGTEIRIDDSVLIEQRRTEGVVTDLIESAADQVKWNVKEPGVMLKSAPFGSVFVPVAMFASYPLDFVKRK